jgi:hypothetical protein
MGIFRKSCDRGGDTLVDGRVATTAKIVAVRDEGTHRERGAMVAVHLLVDCPGGPPFPVAVHEHMTPAFLHAAKPGCRVRVHVDPHTRSGLEIDWAASV